MWDTSEYIAAAYTFGLPHPPGNPFFVIIGRVFSMLPIAPTVAARINVLAAVCSAIAAGVWFLVAEHVLRAWLPARWQRIAGGVLAALIGATAFTVWNQSVVNEKVYTVSLAGIALVSWLAVRWSDRADGPRADRALVMIAYLCGLGYANHMAGMLPAPAIAALVLLRRPATLFRWKLLLACLVALFVGVTPFATQPIRAAHFPAMNEGEPTACRVKLEWSCTMSKATYDAFMYNFNRGQYGKPNLSDRQASFGEQVGMWWLYFRWQWFRDANGETSVLPIAARRDVPGARSDRRVDSLSARSAQLLVFRNAHVHDDAAARSTTSTSSWVGRRIRRRRPSARFAIETTSFSGASRRGAYGRRSV